MCVCVVVDVRTCKTNVMLCAANDMCWGINVCAVAVSEGVIYLDLEQQPVISVGGLLGVFEESCRLLDWWVLFHA